jgi:acetyltransferase-like isoleucine patch superfamily enzyme
MSKLEPLFLRIPYGFVSRLRVLLFIFLGMKLGRRNRFEAGRTRRVSQIKMGDFNHFSEGWYLWPEDTPSSTPRIVIGSNNYFNRNLMIDACGRVEIGDNNMFGPDIYITDSNHAFGAGIAPYALPMKKGFVRIGNCCWIGAKAVILKDVELGDYCVVAAGAVVTKSVLPGTVVAGVPAKPISDS